MTNRLTMIRHPPSLTTCVLINTYSQRWTAEVRGDETEPVSVDGNKQVVRRLFTHLSPTANHVDDPSTLQAALEREHCRTKGSPSFTTFIFYHSRCCSMTAAVRIPRNEHHPTS